MGRRMTRREAPEGQLVKSVIDVLALGGCMAWRQNNLPAFTVLRRWPNKTATVAFHRGVVRKGIADVGGIAPTGRIVQVECKRSDGKLSDEQAQWLTDVAAAGGISMLCRSIDQVATLINQARLMGWDRVPSPWPGRGGDDDS